MAEESKNASPDPAWKAWVTLFGIPAASTAVVQYVTKNPVLSAGVAAVSALGVAAFAPVSKEIKTWYDEWVKRTFDEKKRFGRGGFRVRYLNHLIFRHRTFDVKGLSTQGPYSLELEKVFVDFNIVSQAPAKTSSDPIRGARQLLTGRHSIWDFLSASEIHNLVIIGAPGSGKTTLLKFMALTLAANKREGKKVGVARRLPILLFLRDHADKIAPRDEKGKLKEVPTYTYTLAQAIEESLKRFEGPSVPNADWFIRRLGAGNCLVFLDGLDEVADATVRKRVAEWVEQQIQAHGNNLFVVTSRPGGYKDNPISGVNVLEICPFTREQQKQFVENWYLANETMSAQKADEGVRMAAREGATDLLRRIRNTPALSDLAVNPLLLTMIATVHRYRSSLPGRRVELYSEICEVFLGKRREALGIAENFTPVQKQRVLQPLAYEMMCREIREIPGSEAARIIAEPLQKIDFKTRPEEFLKSIEHGSGLLLEREDSIYSFAHLTFQEYLASVYIQEQQFEKELKRHVTESWWHETIRLYCAKATDATPVIQACLDANSYDALPLAVECEEEGGMVQPQVRLRIQDLLTEQVESDIPGEWHVAAETLLRLRLRRMVRLDDNKDVDNTLVTHAEYQLFVDEMREHEKFYHPDHWQNYRFPKGQGRTPVVGVRPSDAIDYCEWLTKRTGGVWNYRPPLLGETTPADMEKGIQKAGYWIIGGDYVRCEIISSLVSLFTRERLQTRLENDLALARDIDRDLDRTRIRDRARSFDRALVLVRTFDIERVCTVGLNLDRIHDRVRDRNRAHARAIVLGGLYDDSKWTDVYIPLVILEERIEGYLSAWEGIRIVREKTPETAYTNLLKMAEQLETQMKAIASGASELETSTKAISEEIGSGGSL